LDGSTGRPGPAPLGDLYHGRRFETLAALEANFKPATFSHTFITLLSLVNDKQAEEGIHEFWARFEGHLHNMSQATARIPSILQAVLFSWLLHPRYKAINDLFASKQKDIFVASIDLLFRMHNSWMSFLSLVLTATLLLSQMIC
jgi:hypothetical protein